jgi:hypothetical protein
MQFGISAETTLGGIAGMEVPMSVVNSPWHGKE